MAVILFGGPNLDMTDDTLLLLSEAINTLDSFCINELIRSSIHLQERLKNDAVLADWMFVSKLSLLAP